MRRLIHLARRYKLALAATALLMAGAGCVGAIHQTGEQLTQDALKPITVPLQVYDHAVETASNVEAVQQLQIQQAGGLGQ